MFFGFALICFYQITLSTAQYNGPPYEGPINHDQEYQTYPPTPNPPGTFSNNQPLLVGFDPDTKVIPPSIYAPRDIDLPFHRLFTGSAVFYKTVNNPAANSGVWGAKNDNANQGACGIPTNSYWGQQVAVHPYFLKYAPLQRYCMQDVCISAWPEGAKSDIVFKVTDICGSNSTDGIPCATPSDIKVERYAGQAITNSKENPQGDTVPVKIRWFFMKCWANGLPQPAYRNPKNWWTQPPLPENQQWHYDAGITQQKNNQASYPQKGWPTYPDSSYNTLWPQVPVDDWVPGSEPSWKPIAGGKSADQTPAAPVPAAVPRAC